MRSPISRFATLTVVALFVLAACTSAATPVPTASPATTAPPLGDCPPLDVSNGIDLDFLSHAPSLSGNGLIVEVLVAADTGEPDLGRLPLEATLKVSGSNPAEAIDLRAVAFEAGETGCAVRILVDREVLESPKALPLLVEIEVDGTTLGGAMEGSGNFCTWLATDTPQSAAIECMFGSASGTPRRAWVRLSWSGVVASPTTLPAWATTALGPLATPPSDLSLVLRPLDPAPFVMTDPPFRVGSSLEAGAVAERSGGWVVAGSYQPFGAGDEISVSDAVVWWSGDGRTFERVDSGSVFGGPGYQWTREVVADTTGWWIIGGEIIGPNEDDLRNAPLLWRSTDGRNWRRIAPAVEGSIHAAIGDGRGGLIAAAVDSEGRPIVWRIDQDGRIASTALLESPPGDQTTEVLPMAIAGTSGAYLIVGLAWPDLLTVAWTSIDGLSWSRVPGEAPRSLTALVDAQDCSCGSVGAHTMAKTRLGWFVGGAGWIARSTDLQSWEVVLAEAGTWISGFVEHRGMVVALSAGETATAFSTPEGTSWRPVLFEEGARPAPYSIRPIAGASDGADLLVVGAREPDAAVWIAVEP